MFCMRIGRPRGVADSDRARDRNCCGGGVAVPYAGMTRIRFEGVISGRAATPRLTSRL